MLRARAALYKGDGFSGGIVENFSIHRVEVKRSARIISAPIETGTQSFDNKVLDPAVIIVHGYIDIENNSNDYMTTMKTLENMYRNRDYKFYSLTDGCMEYQHLIMQTLPIIRDVDKVDLIEFDITFLEAMLVQKQRIESANSENSDIINTGNTNGITR